MPLPPTVFRVAYEADRFLADRARDVRRAVGALGALEVAAYRGHGTASRAVLLARVLEGRGLPVAHGPLALGASVLQSVRRYATRPVPRARLRVTWEEASWEARTDREGFLRLEVEPPASARGRGGWHALALEVEGGAARAALEVQLSGAQTELAVLSDVDDTMVETDVPNLARRARAMFLSDWVRRPLFDGVAALYAALRDGRSGRAENLLFYVSSSPWNLYDHLVHVLATGSVPRGTLLLRDWGLRPDGFAPGGGHGHKRAVMRELFGLHAERRFLLLGDTGQEDARHYAAIAAEHPGRIAAVYLRRVRAGAGRLRDAEAAVRALRGGGVEAAIFETTDELAGLLRAQGLVRA